MTRTQAKTVIKKYSGMSGMIPKMLSGLRCGVSRDRRGGWKLWGATKAVKKTLASRIRLWKEANAILAAK